MRAPLLLPALPMTSPLLCMPLRTPTDDLLLPAGRPAHRLLLADCCRSLLLPEAAPAARPPPVPVLSTEPTGPVMADAMLLHKA
jgi:hypothetical protein